MGLHSASFKAGLLSLRIVQESKAMHEIIGSCDCLCDASYTRGEAI